jgi:hypothetical protein
MHKKLLNLSKSNVQKKGEWDSHSPFIILYYSATMVFQN